MRQGRAYRKARALVFWFLSLRRLSALASLLCDWAEPFLPTVRCESFIMNRGVLPFVLAVVLIAVVTVVEGVYLRDRWGTPGVEAAELGQRFAQVPKKIGDWTGIDMPVSRDVKERSGAVNFVNRRYTQAGTDRSVDLWLIIGHSRDIIRHTPDICYATSGFQQHGSQQRHSVYYNGNKEARFFTSKFNKEDALVRQTQRVFWAWNHPDIQEWDAPDKARFHYGMSTRTLYKMYFTSRLMTDEDTFDDSPAAQFANLVLPVIDAALFSEQPTATPSPESRVESPEPEVASPEPG